MTMISSSTAADNSAFVAAVHDAERRAQNSYFDQHVILDDERGYITIDEGDFGTLPMHLIDRIVYTVAGDVPDEY